LQDNRSCADLSGGLPSFESAHGFVNEICWSGVASIRVLSASRLCISPFSFSIVQIASIEADHDRRSHRVNVRIYGSLGTQPRDMLADAAGSIAHHTAVDVYKLILDLTDGMSWPLSLQAAWLSSPA
jgi:hypothetical protein